MKKVLNAILSDGCNENTNTLRPIGEILTEYFLQGNAPIAVAYRKHKAEHLAEQKPEVASTVTSNEKGGEDGKNRI